MARRRLSLLVMVLTLSGGSGCSTIPHAWQYRMREDPAVPVQQWRALPRAHHCRVDARARDDATARLQEQDFVSLTSSEVPAYCAGFELPPNQTGRPYLVRGVANPSPAYSVVRFDEPTGRCAVYQATYDGENMLFVWLQREVRPSPVVAYLPSEPTEIHPIAEMGGDWILDTQGYAQEREYARQLCWDETDFVLRVAAGGAEDLRDRCSRHRSGAGAADR